MLTFSDRNAGMPRMKRLIALTFVSSAILSTLLLTGCQGGGMPKMFWSADDKPAYAQGRSSHAQGESRAPLDVPPELRKELEVPMPDQVASDVARGDALINKESKAAVAGKAVALNSRRYDQTASQMFSAIIDAMTALNLPVQSVDSPSGVITTDWIRPNANSSNSYMGVLTSMVGAGPVHLRYRFVARVFRTNDGQTELQIRTLSQQFLNAHWINKPIERKVSLELFDAVEERLPQKNQAQVIPESLDNPDAENLQPVEINTP